jgi:hypothetical protein
VVHLAGDDRRLGSVACRCGPDTRRWGDGWLESRDTLIAEVPSVIVPEEPNLLIHPQHPAIADVEVVRRWLYDARLLPGAGAAASSAGPPWREPLGQGVGLAMVPIPAGSFVMGSPPDEGDG